MNYKNWLKETDDRTELRARQKRLAALFKGWYSNAQ